MITQYRETPFVFALALAGVLAMPGAAQPVAGQPAAAQSAAAQSDAAARAWLARQFAAYDGGQYNQPAGAPNSLVQALATWDWLRRTPPVGRDPTLAVQADFQLQYPDWPNVSAIRSRAEQQALKPATPGYETLAYFRRVPPQTAGGQAKMALLMSGAEAEAMARLAWVRPGIPVEIEAPFVARFGPLFTRAETAQRVDQLLWAGQVSAARRALPLLDADARQLADARIAYRTNMADADSLMAALPAAARQTIGLVHDRSVWLERRGQLAAAEALLGSGDFAAGATAPRSWLDRRLTMARVALRRGDNDTAYRLLANHKAYGPAVDVGALSLAERILLSDSEWLAGWLALRRLNRPGDAARHFNNFSKAVNTPVSLSRGDYWLGRAEQARGNQPAARAAFERGARYFDYFYGQLAAGELGRAPTLPTNAAPPPTAAARSAFAGKPLLQALRVLNDLGSRERESLFVRALGASVATPDEAQLAAEWGRTLDRADLAVWAWRTARPRGDLSIFAAAYPQLPKGAPVPSGEWIISHAIARQESSFDRTAVSRVGARGLMQLMPGTAADVAKKLGLAYAPARLTEDPAYNLTLGSWYISQRRNDFSNAAMAIAAYNGGAGNVRKWLTANGDPRVAGSMTADMIDWVELIPFQETRNYVQRVIENAVVYSLLDPERRDSQARADIWLRQR